MLQVPSLEQHQNLKKVVEMLEQQILSLKDQLNVGSQIDKPWYTAKEVKELYDISDDRTLRSYERIKILTPKHLGSKKLYSREQVLNLPIAMEEYKKNQV